MSAGSRTGVDVVVTASRVVAPAGVLAPGWVEIRDGRITATGSGVPPTGATDVLGDVVLAPGFVDVHCHGGGGASFGADLDQSRRVIRTHRAHGTTTLLASLVTAPVAELARQVDALAELVDDGELAGVHLEGPWLSRPFCGAHDPSLLRAPTLDDVARLVRPGLVRMVTLAPELDHALDAVGRIVDAGAVAALGHTDADADIARAALAAGASHATHLFNAMRPLHHRDASALIALLDSQATLELVRDGVHLHRDLCHWLDAVVAPERVVAVTDAMAAAGAPDGEYALGTLDVSVIDAVATVSGTTTLAGSTATADVLFAHAAHGSTDDADLLRAVAQTAGNPARALGLEDVGSLEAGRRADLVVLDAALQVVRVMRHGEWLAIRPHRQHV